MPGIYKVQKDSWGRDGVKVTPLPDKESYFPDYYFSATEEQAVAKMEESVRDNYEAVGPWVKVTPEEFDTEVARREKIAEREFVYRPVIRRLEMEGA